MPKPPLYRSFGNRHHGRFPRVAATVDGGGFVWLTYCPDRRAYEQGEDYGFRCILLNHREAARLAEAIAAALPLARREGRAVAQRKRRARLRAGGGPVPEWARKRRRTATGAETSIEKT